MSAIHLRDRVLLATLVTFGLAGVGTAYAAEPKTTPAAPAPDATPKTADVDLVKQDPKNASVFKFDFGVPATPALTLLGVDKDKVTQSNSLKPFAISLPSLISGKQSGQAASLDFAPAAYLVPADQQTYASYAKTNALWFRTHVGLGVYNGVSDADASKQKASKASLGLSVSLLNTSDPLLASFPGRGGSAWVQCFDSAAPAIRAVLPGPPSASAEEDALLVKLNGALKREADLRKMIAEAPQAEKDGYTTALTSVLKTERDVEAQIDQLRQNATAPKVAKADAKAEGSVDPATYVKTCAQVANLAASLGGDLDFGFGSVWTGSPGKIEHLTDPSSVIWASYRHALGVKGPTGETYDDYVQWYKGLDQWFVVGLSARIGLREQISTGDKTTPKVEANTYSAWLGAERYTPNDRLALQLGQERTDPTASIDSKFGGSRTRYLATYDRKLNDGGLWVTGSYGEASGAGALKSDKTAKLTFTLTAPDAVKITGAPATAK